jgi:hypothetical protein
MKTYDFIIPNCDTDSISFCYPDFRPISTEMQNQLIDEINAILPPKIQMDADGYFPCVLILKTKNYALYDGKKIKIKGSALKASTKCPALKEVIKTFIDTMIFIEDPEQMKAKLQELYMQYVHEIMNIDNIQRWSSRKTYSSTMASSMRLNETKVMDALVGSSYVEGDRFSTFFLSNDNLCLTENFTGDYNKQRMLKSLWDTVKVFETVLDIKSLFVNYALVKNFKKLEQ